jgi:hypothetical protein
MAVTDSTISSIHVKIPYKDEVSIAATTVEKIEKHDPLQANIAHLHPETSEVIVVPLVFGSQGCTPPETRGALSHSGLKKKRRKELVCTIF